MSDKYLNAEGVQYLWNGIKSYFDSQISLILNDGIPAEYQRIEFLQSNSKDAYIDTGLSIDGSYTVIAEGCTGTDKAGILFDSYVSSALRQGGVIYNRTSPRYDYWWTGVGYTQWALSEIDYASKFKLTQSKDRITIEQNGLSFSKTFTGGTDETSSQANIYLFSTERTDIITDCSILYSFRVMKNNQVIMNMQPVIRVRDHVPGMYDKISETFFTAAGNEPLIAGGLLTPSSTMQPVASTTSDGLMSSIDKRRLDQIYHIIEDENNYIFLGSIPVEQELETDEPLNV